MSELDGVLDVASDNTAGVFELSANTLAVLYFLLQHGENYSTWLDYPDEVLTDAQKDDIDRLVGVATYEVLNMVHPVPVGTMAMYAGGGVPSKWMTCTGDAISRADYPELFDAIGETWGAGNGTTTFNIPDMRDKIPMGVLGSVVSDVADSAGALTHTLTTAELPAHNHTITDPGHNHPPLSPATVIQGSHAGGAGGYAAANQTRTVDQSATTGNRTTGITIDNTGSGNAHSILPPVKGVHFMIYVGV